MASRASPILKILCRAQVMQDWLNERKLDRKALTALSTNLTAVEAWEHYVREEADAVVGALVAAVAGEPAEGADDDNASERVPGGSASASDVDGDADDAAEGVPACRLQFVMICQF